MDVHVLVLCVGTRTAHLGRGRNKSPVYLRSDLTEAQRHISAMVSSRVGKDIHPIASTDMQLELHVLRGPNMSSHVDNGYIPNALGWAKKSVTPEADDDDERGDG